MIKFFICLLAALLVPKIIVAQENSAPATPTIWTDHHSLFDDKAEQPKNHWSGLPFMAEEARKRGYEIEPPFVFAVQYNNQNQSAQQVPGSTLYSNIRTQDLFGVKGINLGLNPDGTPDIFVSTGKTKENTQTKGVRAGVWVFPFLQVYGLLNQITGYSDTPTTSLTQLDFKFQPGWDAILKPAAEAALKGIFGNNYLGNGLVRTSENVRLNLDATNFGGGFTMAGGYKKTFFMIDVNYTYSDFKFSDDYTKTLVMSSRIGYDTRLYDKPFRVWVGFMSQHVSSKITGYMSALQFEGLTGKLMGAINPDGKGQFEVRQNLVTPINAVIGGRYTFTDHTAFMLEVGYGGSGGRSSFLANFEFLF